MSALTQRSGFIRQMVFWLSMGLIAILLLCCGFTAGLVLGQMQGWMRAYHKQYLEERDVLASILASDPAFINIEISEASSDGAYLSGKVSAADDMVRLHAAVVRAIGENRAKYALNAVSVAR